MRDEALTLATTDNARRLIETSYQDGLAAARAEDAVDARKAVASMKQIKAMLAKDLTIRVISRPGEMSGVFRLHDDAQDVRNYYIIVEGIDPSGQAHAFQISSEEDQKTDRVKKWGIRVSEAVFNRIAADKRDDQIIQNATVGSKPRGALAPTYSIETSGGTILEW